MKKKWGNILIFAIFLVGLITVFYPSISNFWNQHLEKKLMNNYETVVQQLEQQDLTKEMEAARAYNEAHKDNRVPDAFAEGEVKEDAEYENLLNVDQDGVMAILEIPCINVKLPVFHGTRDEELQKGAGHLRQVRLRHRPRHEDLRHVRFPEADRRDRHGAVPRRRHSHSG